MIQSGESAPDFEWVEDGRRRTLHDLARSGPVLLAFYPLAHSHVCRQDVRSLADWAARSGSAWPILALSVDEAEHARSFFALHQASILVPVADPDLRVARAYGVARGEGLCERASALVGEDGRVLRSAVHDLCFPRPTNLFDTWRERAASRNGDGP